MTVDLAEWSGRSCYYWGRFFDVTHQVLLRQYLRPGDTYLDVGANIGYQSLFARKLVGPAGTVVSVEPHPDLFPILAGHFGINRISGTKLFNCALGDEAGEAMLSQPGNQTGQSTLLASDEPGKSVPVQVRTGDELFADIAFTGRTIMKIDVEGFELQVLRGLKRTLSERIDFAYVEVTPEKLESIGESAQAVYDFMSQLGFKAAVPQLSWTMGLFSPKLVLSPIGPSRREQHDVWFSKE
jgi:FkbM family methyltransferase